MIDIQGKMFHPLNLIGEPACRHKFHSAAMPMSPSIHGICHPFVFPTWLAWKLSSFRVFRLCGLQTFHFSPPSVAGRAQCCLVIWTTSGFIRQQKGMPHVIRMIIPLCAPKTAGSQPNHPIAESTRPNSPLLRHPRLMTAEAKSRTIARTQNLKQHPVNWNEPKINKLKQ